ncbi:FUSC family protein [Microbacterium sorbitolivorans]|uniref:FUSC family protein n=1 Tax=Microbacterium sorbitolivorans TaxID=1867410 RepID=A0A367XY35_9MICO|nr:FUSC family protein [Microbacterium sorbitolivorans]RCK58555.1 FUSC family protein [Microbacterium sorbitolivorans]GGF37463.1 FUSC family protein [Microbacterium sorbitolivorans]
MTSPRRFQATTTLPRIRPQFALWPAMRSVRAPQDAWYLRSGALIPSAAIAMGILAAFGRLDLAGYTMAGSMCALFAHALPYRRRAITLAGFIALLTLGCGVSLAVAAATENMLVRIIVAALLAAIIKVAHDASSVGMPPAVIPIFLVTALGFVPETWSGLALHIALIAGAGAISWLVSMAPALVRRDGPERRAVAVAMRATARVGRNPEDPVARDALAAAITAAHRTLAYTRGEGRAALAAHLVACERILADPSQSHPDRAEENARALVRSRTRIPTPPLTEAEQARIRGARLALEAPRSFAARHRILAAFHPTSPSAPYFWRVLVAALVAALVSWALGGDRPFWAITAASVIVQPNLLLTWRKAPPRALGALVGVWLYALIAPVAQVDLIVAAVLVIVLNTLTEAFIARNYFIAQVFVTPLALLMSQFGGQLSSSELIWERSVDTVVGVVAGVLAAFLIRNGHLRRHAKEAVERLEAATAAAGVADPGADPDPAARGAEADPAPAPADPDAAAHARRAIIAALADLAAAVRTADNEWWTHRVDEARVIAAQNDAYRALAGLG